MAISDTTKTSVVVGGISGLVMSVIGLVPILGCINLILMFFPGVITVFMLNKSGMILSNKEAAVNGAITGVAAGVIGLLINMSIGMLIGTASLFGKGGTDAGTAAAGMAVAGVLAIIMFFVGVIVVTGVNAFSGWLYNFIRTRT